MNQIRSAILMILLAAWGTTASGNDVRISIVVHENAVARAERIFLRDVAAIKSDNKDIQEQLGDIPVSSAPRRGHPVQIAQTRLLAIVKQRMPDLVDRIDWNGATSVALSTKGEKIDASRLVSAAIRELMSRYQQEYQEVTFEVAQTQDDIWVPAGEIILKPRLLHDGLQKRVCVWVDISADGRSAGSVPLWFRAEAKRKVLVAARDLRPGMLNEENVVFEMRDVLAGEKPITEPAVPGARLVRSIQAGEVIARKDIEVAPLIAKSKTLMVKVIAGSVTIETQGMALADGDIGSVIPVQAGAGENVSRVSAQIVADGLAVVNIR